MVSYIGTPLAAPSPKYCHSSHVTQRHPSPPAHRTITIVANRALWWPRPGGLSCLLMDYAYIRPGRVLRKGAIYYLIEVTTVLQKFLSFHRTATDSLLYQSARLTSINQYSFNWQLTNCNCRQANAVKIKRSCHRKVKNINLKA
jgi:hypothetical protein